MSEPKPQAVQFGKQPPGNPAVQFGSQPATAGTVETVPQSSPHNSGVVPEYAGGDPVPDAAMEPGSA